jgi:ribosomal protein L12E/L44/L45/RPP1/RPP2
MPDILLQPMEKPIGALARDFHELMCGPASSAEGALAPALTAKRARVAAASRKAGTKYGHVPEEEEEEEEEED